MLEMDAKSRPGHGYGDHAEDRADQHQYVSTDLKPLTHPHVVHIYSTSSQ